MNAVRKLSIVDCPQPETSIRPVVYGAAPWSRLGCPLKPLGTPIKANPNGGDLHAIMFAQSKLTRNGVVARAPDPVTAARILASDGQPRRVTVPEPLHSHTPAAAYAAEDWFNGPECAAILAQPVEPCIENPFAGDCEPSEIDA